MTLLALLKSHRQEVQNATSWGESKNTGPLSAAMSRYVNRLQQERDGQAGLEVGQMTLPQAWAPAAVGEDESGEPEL